MITTPTPAAENRAERRSNVFLTATLDTAGKSTPVRIRNISSQGALVDAPSLPPVGTRARLMRGRLSADGHIAWLGAGQAGLAFDIEIDVTSWVQRTGHSGQHRVDGVIAALRSGSAVVSDLQDSGDTESLATISAALDHICGRLLRTQGMSIEFGEELVKLDSVAHSLRRLAARRRDTSDHGQP